ncbi:MAG: helix-turn-helix domain-containing protein [Candidatus Caenarcaniphilales bacterium]|nr:helix-turn-helix domain-containing protein [Candidatus Caenarcaniphilales bacterium]
MAGLIQKYWAKIVKQIKAKRQAEKITQKNLSAITGISTQTISRLEQADENIQLATVLEVCHSLGLELEVKQSYSFRLMIYRMLVDTIKRDPYCLGGFLHNTDPGHPIYAAGANNENYSFPNDDNENKNPVFQFLKSFSEDMIEYDDIWDDYPPITQWQEFCSLVYGAYENHQR